MRIRQGAAAVMALVALCGCGSLRQSVSFRGLTKENMDFIDSVKSGAVELRLSTLSGSSSTHKTASYVIPTFPVMYWKTLGQFKNGYGLSTVFLVFPLLTTGRGAVLDADGAPLEYVGLAQVPFLFVYGSATRDASGPRKETTWGVGLISLPLLGPCIAFGNETLRLLWIPIVKPRPAASPAAPPKGQDEKPKASREAS